MIRERASDEERESEKRYFRWFFTWSQSWSIKRLGNCLDNCLVSTWSRWRNRWEALLQSVKSDYGGMTFDASSAMFWTFLIFYRHAARVERICVNASVVIQRLIESYALASGLTILRFIKFNWRSINLFWVARRVWSIEDIYFKITDLQFTRS